MGKRGPSPRPGVRKRLFAILSEEDAARLDVLGASGLADLLHWALPRYTLRRDGDAPAELGTQTTIRPERPRSPQVVSVSASPDGARLQARAPERDEDLRALLKAQRFEWDAASGSWVRPLGRKTGSPSDRVAELAASLLKARFIVAVDNARLVEMVLHGSWIPEQKRWVELVTRTGDLLLRWEHGADEVWQATQHLKGARWDTALQGSLIHPNRHVDLRDFAERHGFQFTEAAEAALQQAAECERRQLLALDVPAPLQPRRKPRAKKGEEVTVPLDLLAD